MSELSEALKTAQEQHGGWSVRRIEREMETAGHSVSYSTVALYLNGRHGVPEDSTLSAFAAIFPELSISRLRHLAHLPPGENDPYIPPADASRLSRTQRQALDAVIAAMLEREGMGFPSGSFRSSTSTRAGSKVDIQGPDFVIEVKNRGSQPVDAPQLVFHYRVDHTKGVMEVAEMIQSRLDSIEELEQMVEQEMEDEHREYPVPTPDVGKPTPGEQARRKLKADAEHQDQLRPSHNKP